MFPIYKKEIKQFFNTIEGYLAISIFFLVSSLTLWYIPGGLNIFYNKTASLLPFFSMAPWILLILSPAITMKIMSTELLERTDLILFTKPIKIWEIIISKFLASTTINILSILPSLIFIVSIYQLSEPTGNIDTGELLCSYIGLVLVILLYNAIGLFGSCISKNTMISFISTIMIIIFFLFGCDLLAQLNNNKILDYMNLFTHYESISRGVLDTKNIIYFLSLTCIFLILSNLITKQKKHV